MSIGVLFGCFGRKIDGDSWLTWWFFLIYQGNPSISNLTGHLCSCLPVAFFVSAGTSTPRGPGGRDQREGSGGDLPRASRLDPPRGATFGWMPGTKDGGQLGILNVGSWMNVARDENSDACGLKAAECPTVGPRLAVSQRWPIWPWSTPMVLFWGRRTTHFRTYFCGDWVPFTDPWP